jgi:hypothetical protein
MQTYFISDGQRVKIGKSRNPPSRLAQLQTSHAAQLTLLLSIEEDEEKTLHQRFAAFRLRGEWFTLSPEILAFIDDPSLPYTPEPEPIKQKYVTRSRYCKLTSDDILQRFYQVGGRVHHFFGRRMCFATTVSSGRYRFQWDHKTLICMSDLVDQTTETYTLKAYAEACNALITEAKKTPYVHLALFERSLSLNVRHKNTADVEDYLRWIDAASLPSTDEVHGAINQWCTFVELRGSRASDIDNAFNKSYYIEHLSPLVEQYAVQG